MKGVFSSLSDEDEQRLRAISVQRSFERDEVVFHKDDPAIAMHYIEKGRFAVCVPTRGTTATIAVLGPGQTFVELALLEGQVRTAKIVALEPARTLMIRSVEFTELRKRHPAINEAVVQLLVGQVIRLTTVLIE